MTQHGIVDENGTFRAAVNQSSAIATGAAHALRTRRNVQLATKQADGSVQLHGVIRPSGRNPSNRSA